MNTAQPTVWTGTVSDEQQAKVPWVVGVALVLGVFLWMGPYMGVNVVLLPAKTALLREMARRVSSQCCPPAP